MEMSAKGGSCDWKRQWIEASIYCKPVCNGEKKKKETVLLQLSLEQFELFFFCIKVSFPKIEHYTPTKLMFLEFTFKYAFLFILYKSKQLGFLLIKRATILAQQDQL